ncbi:DUF748 domain-containing protein [Labilibaculum sp.]|uniref:DUF748 domain-containing protein n=1 Tax=Labilibaculum sp. TaxID=2060723 RepID=UPI00356A5D65
MKLSKKKIGIALLFIVLFFFFLMLSSIVKYWVNKNSEELIGRKVEISDLHFNYAKFSVKLDGFRLYELDKKNDFISCKEFYINLNPWKLFTREYSVSEIYLNELNVSLHKTAEGYNFSDLMVEENSQAVDSTSIEGEKKLLKFAFQNIQLKNGNISYYDDENENVIDLKDVNVHLPLIAWNNERSEMGLKFAMGKSGEVSIDADIDHSVDRYAVNLDVSSMDVSPFVVYLKDYMTISKMNGLLSTKLHVNGSLTDFMDVFVKGDASVKQFSIYDSQENLFLATKSADVVLDSIDLGTSHYQIGRINLDSTFLYADLYAESSNVEQIFQPYLDSDTIEDSTDTLFYSIDTIVFQKGGLRFTDHTLNRKFVYDLSHINVNIGTIYADAPAIPINYEMILNGAGRSSGELTFSLKDLYQFNMKGKVEKLDLMSFSPYTEFYIARPITQGDFDYTGSISMTSKSLTNQNDLKISELDFGAKTKDPNTIKAPVRLALYLLKDQNDLIQFELPVSGNPNDPEFRFGKIVWKTLLNFLVKTASKPFGLLGNLAGTNPESIEKIPFDLLQDSLDANQMVTLEKIASILKKKSELKFLFSQETDFSEEKDLLAVQECAHRFVLSSDSLVPSIKNDQLLKWANEDLAFKNYILSFDQSSVDESIQDNCKVIIGDQNLTSMFDILITKRNSSLENYLSDSLLIDKKAFEVKTADLRNLSIEQRAPKFRVEVSLQ